MSLQDRMRNRKGQFFRKNRKGVSIMVGYVLLVVFAVILSVVTYNWIRTYVPAESLQCPDGVSVFVKITDYNCSTNQFNITVKNNGRFDILGYFIHAANESTQEIATIDLSKYLNGDFGGQKFGSSVAFVSAQDNSFSPGQVKKNVFDLPLEIGRIMLIQIIPTRLQEQDNKKRFISCGDSKIKQTIVCGVSTGVPPPTNSCDGTWSPPEDAIVECDGGIDCQVDCTCPSGYIADGLGACEVYTPPTSCDGTWSPPEDTGVECEIGANCDDCLCDAGYEPDGSGGCTLLCGNGVIDTGEQCDGGIDCISPGQVNECQCHDGYIADGSLGCTTIGNGQCDGGETCAEEPEACEGQQAECVDPGETCQSGSCVFNADGSFNSCGDYCALFGYSLTFACQDNPNKCEPPQGPEGGIYIGNVEGANETYGNSFCIGDPFCCCRP